MGVYLWGSPDYGSMVQSDSWLYLSLTYVKSTTLYSIKYLLLIQPNYNTQTLFNKISSNLTIESHTFRPKLHVEYFYLQIKIYNLFL